MRKLKGITINGEWLGNNVIINGVFRAICEISPSVMQEFIKVINSIDKLEEAVKINKFSFPDNNSIEIEFSNKSLSGLADLYFYLDNGYPKLKDSRLVLNGGAGKDVCETLPASGTENTVNAIIPEESTSQEIIEDNLPEKNLEKNISETEEIPRVDEVEPPVLDEMPPVKEEAHGDMFVTKENTIDAVSESEPVEKQTVIEQNPPVNNTITKDAITSIVDEIITKAPNLAGLAQPVQIQVMQPETTQAPQVIPVITPVPAEKNDKIEKSDVAVKEKDNEVEHILPKENSAEILNVSDEGPEFASPAEDNEKEEFLSELSDDEITDVVDSEEETRETNDSDEILNEEFITESTVNETETDEVSEIEENKNLENSEEKSENYVDTEVIDLPNENDDKIQNDETEDIEAIGECLADFYNIDKPSEEVMLDDKTRSNIAMQAMLSEVVLLKDELNKLKAEQPKPTLNEFFGDSEPEYAEIEDDEADFKILGDGARINASILDEDLFIAGRKLYRWGDTLYLDE